MKIWIRRGINSRQLHLPRNMPVVSTKERQQGGKQTAEDLGGDAIEGVEVGLTLGQQLRVLTCYRGVTHDFWVIIYSFAGKDGKQF